MKNNNGFTLVESLVTAMISVIIASVVYTVFSMHNNQVNESMILSNLQRQYENVIAQIASDVRRSNRVLVTGETFNPLLSPLTPVNNATSIHIYDYSGSIIGAYRIQESRVWELDSITGNWKNFEAGGGWVFVDAALSVFSAPAFRNEIGITLRLKHTGNNTTYYLPIREDAFICRN